MVKRNKKEKPAPFVNRTRDEDNKRLATVEEADAKWERQLAARNPPEKKKAEPRKGAIEEEFIRHSPLSEIARKNRTTCQSTRSYASIERCRILEGTARRISALNLALEMFASPPGITSRATALEYKRLIKPWK